MIGDELTLVLMGAVYLLTVGVLVFVSLPRKLRIIFVVLTALETGFFLAFVLPIPKASFWHWFLDPNTEESGAAIYSSLMLMLVAVTAGSILLNSRRDAFWQKLYWFLMMSLFAFMALDEFLSIHESFKLWRTMYLLTGIALAAFSLIVIWQGRRDERRYIVLFVLGFGIIGFGGIMLDAFSNQHIVTIGPLSFDWFVCDSRVGFLGVPCQRYANVEEFFEKSGTTIVLMALVSVALRRTKGKIPQRHRLKQGLVIAGGVYAFWMIGSVWFFASLEVPFAPARTTTTYLDGGLDLTHYRLSSEHPEPGDALGVTLYMRANRALDLDYSLSMHLVAHPEGTSLAQDDALLGEWRYPTRAWIPGLYMRNHYRLQLPEDIPTPASYWLTASVWQRRPSNRVDLTMTDRPQLLNNTIILDRVAVLPTEPLPDLPPDATPFTFEGDIMLADYALPDAPLQPDVANTFSFRWHTEAAVDVHLTQFVHLFHTESDFAGVFDRQPFDGRFPTHDWPAGLQVIDDWVLQLPADFPPGEYVVHTGLYDALTLDRLPVVSAEGQSVMNHSIMLGSIIVSDAP